MQSSHDEITGVVIDISKLFYDRLKKLNLTDSRMATAYGTLAGVLMETIAQNTNEHVAVRLMIAVLEAFSADRPSVNILVHEQAVPPEGKMQ